MRERIIRRYSACFKRQVVEELEGGRFASVEQARAHYEIGGKATIKRWLQQYGKHHLQAKVVRVEQVGEADRMRELKRRIAELERALGRTQAQSVLSATYLELACERLGEEVEDFKKKFDGRRCIASANKEASA